jgi:hypothetical protein
MQVGTADRADMGRWLAEIFVVGNLGFLAVDIALAHGVNEFAHPAEWVPLVFSLVSPLLLIRGVLRRDFMRGSSRMLGLAVGTTSVLVGVAGLIMHLHNTFFVSLTLKSLVYTAPFAAPLAYTGIGLLLLLIRLEPRNSSGFGPWVTCLALGGFIGNFALTLCDHAQNGFFYSSEWIAVISSAFAVSFLFMALLRQQDARFRMVCGGVMLLQVLVGSLGFALHLQANLTSPASSVLDSMLYGAPIFAPLLLPNLALLAMLGLWQTGPESSRTTAAASIGG